jgi:hypothetical protein
MCDADGVAPPQARKPHEPRRSSTSANFTRFQGRERAARRESAIPTEPLRWRHVGEATATAPNVGGFHAVPAAPDREAILAGKCPRYTDEVAPSR